MEPEINVPDPLSILYDYQVSHTLTLEKCLETKEAVLEASDTGLGKTMVWCVIAARLRMKLFVICPKIVVTPWFKTAARTGAECIGIANYEMAKLGKYYSADADYMHKKPQSCPYMCWDARIKQKTIANMTINFPPNTLIVIDEAHRGKNSRTQTSEFLKRIRLYVRSVNPHIYTRMAILSATITDTVEDFRMTAFIIGAAQYEIHPYKAWVRRITANHPGETISACINKAVFPEYGSRMRKDTVKSSEHLSTNSQSRGYNVHFHIYMWMMSVTPGQAVHKDIYILIMQMYDMTRMFRDSHVRAVVYQVSPEVEAEITQAHEDINAAIEALKFQQAREEHPLTMILRARQRLEMLKSQTMVDQAMEFLADGFAVVLFVNFTPTVKRMVTQLAEYVSSDIMLQEDEHGNTFYRSHVSVICGGQSAHERAEHIAKFQEGKSIVCVVNIQAGGVGIDLHHICAGARPRKTLFSPPWSAIVLLQGLGRCDRVGAYSDVEQIIVYCSGSVSAVNAAGDGTGVFDAEGKRMNIEEIMAANINRKLQTIGWINDGDLDSVTTI